MRDLASRLRAIVRTNGALPRQHETAALPLRELTYVPEIAGDRGSDLDAAAAALGGRRFDVAGSSCIVIDRRWEPWHVHGRRDVSSYAPASLAEITRLDPRLTSCGDGLTTRTIFFDIETTGLSGGAGTIAFLAGCGWFDADGGFSVRQWLLAGSAGERAMLDALDRVFGDASLLVTYNGRTFDVPVMEMRWAFHRRTAATDGLAHLDMLPVARRLWGGDRSRNAGSSTSEDERAASSCALGALERSVIGFHRLDDVPGFEIPTRYFQFLRFGDAGALAGVLEHNRYDLVSLAAIACRAAAIVRDGPPACATDRERCGLGRLYERAGDVGRAVAAYESAAAGADREAGRQALGRLAGLMARADRFDEAARAWQGVLALAGPSRTFGPLERRAAEALAIYHEHRVRDLDSAQRYAAALERDGRARAHTRAVDNAAHRLARLGRKMARENTRGGPEAALLLTED